MNFLPKDKILKGTQQEEHNTHLTWANHSQAFSVQRKSKEGKNDNIGLGFEDLLLNVVERDDDFLEQDFMKDGDLEFLHV